MLRLGIKPYRKIEERYDRTALRTLIKTGLRTGTKAGTTGTVKALHYCTTYDPLNDILIHLA